MDKFILKIKKYIHEMDNNKLIYNLLILLIIGIIVLIIANILTEDKKDIGNIGLDLQSSDSFIDTASLEYDYGILLEKRLESILMKLKGVGNVKVMITLEDTIEKVPAFNTIKNNEVTSEIDSQGGTREITREDVNIQMITGNEGSLTVLKEIKPTVRGVIVLAEGAEDIEIKEMLYEAVKTVLGISGNKVEVYSSK